MHRSLKIQTFQLTSNDPTLLIENTIFLELGLYCSKKLYKYCRDHYRYIVAATVTPGCYNPPPFKKLIPRFMKKDRSMETRNSWEDHFFDLEEMKVGVITFLIPGSGSCLLSARTYSRKPTSGWGQL
jgi:hypothetical protein